jgi:hypothetical protein
MCSLLNRLYASSVLWTGTRVQSLEYVPETSLQDRERKEKSDLIKRERDSSDIQSEERRESTGDSTCCLRNSKDIYLYN